MRELYETNAPSVDFYDIRIEASGVKGTPTEGDVEFYLKQARNIGGPVLELGVGTGRVALPLARAGFKVVGLDLSPHMLKIARSKLTPELRNRVRFVRGNMARFSLGQKFRLVLIPFRAFQHLKTPGEQRRCLECVRRHLSKGGRFIVDLFDPRLEFCLPKNHAAPKRRDEARNPATGRKVSISVKNRRNDPLAQMLSETWVHTERDGRGRVVRRTQEKLAIRWTYRWEMRYLLELTGFRVLASYGDFKGGPPRYGAEQVWVATPG